MKKPKYCNNKVKNYWTSINQMLKNRINQQNIYNKS